MLDTSAILALLDADDSDHGRCVDAPGAREAPFVVPAGILREIGYLVEAKLRPAGLSVFVADLDRRAFALDCGGEDFAAIGRCWTAIRTCAPDRPTPA